MYSNFPIQRRALCLALLAIGTLVTGCGTTIRDANDLTTRTTDSIAEAQRKADQPKVIVSTLPGAWLMGESVQITQPESPLLRQTIKWAPQKQVSLSDVAAWLSENYDLPVDVSDLVGAGASEAQASPATGGRLQSAPSASPLPPQLLLSPLPSSAGTAAAGAGSASSRRLPSMAIAYDGPISGLLDVVAEKEGVWWKYEDGRVEFYRTITKTIYMPAIARHSNVKSSIIASGGPTNGVSTGTGVSGGSTDSSQGSSSGSSTSSSDYDIDLWKAIEATAKVVAGTGSAGTAQTSASASLGGVTITGTPTQVHNVEQWAKGLADNLSQLVVVNITMYSVTLSGEDNYQWNPDVVFNKLSSVYGLSLTGPAAPAVSSGINPFSLGAKVLNTSTSTSSLNGSQLVYNALSTLGKVTSVNTIHVMTLNGQPSVIQRADQVTYAAQSGSTLAANVGSSSSLTPGVVTTGLTGTVLPRVIDGKITLAMDLTDSVLNGISTFTSGNATIQEPSVSVAALPSSIVLTPGQSLLATGITQSTGQLNRTGVGSPNNPILGGGTDATTGKKLIAIVISAGVM